MSSQDLVNSLEDLTSLIYHVSTIIKNTTEIINHKIDVYRHVSKTTPNILQHVNTMLLTILQQLKIVLESIDSNVNLDSVNYDIRGTWRVVSRILIRLTEDIRSIVLTLPEIPECESNIQYLNRKYHQNVFLQNIPIKSEYLEYCTKCMSRLVMCTISQNSVDDKMIGSLETAYSNPFWYTFDPDNKKLRDLYDILKMSIINSYNKSNSLWKTITQSASSLHALLTNSSKLAIHSHNNEKEHANIMVLRHIWNFSETGLPKLILGLINPPIVTKEILILNTHDDDEYHDDFKHIENLKVYLLYNRVLPFKIPEHMKVTVKVEDELNINKEPLISTKELKDIGILDQNKIKKDDTDDSILLNYDVTIQNAQIQEHIILENENHDELKRLLSESDTKLNIKQQKVNNDIDEESNRYNIILHFHGGGWVSGSPSSHEMYLREWAAITNAMVFSVDYSKSPESKYPKALNECYYVYKKLVEGKMMDIQPRKIIVTGDSAGGNLAMAVTLKAIMNNIRIPDGLILAYPPLDITKSTTPSRVFFANDVLLPYYFLEVCLEAYLNETDDPKNDPLISPIYASDDLLKKLPDDVVFMCAGFDPLLDDSTRFIRRLDSLGKKYKHFVFDLPHAFWNFGQLLKKAQSIVTSTGNIMNEIFNKD